MLEWCFWPEPNITYLRQLLSLKPSFWERTLSTNKALIGLKSVRNPLKTNRHTIDAVRTNRPPCHMTVWTLGMTNHRYIVNTHEEHGSRRMSSFFRCRQTCLSLKTGDASYDHSHYPLICQLFSWLPSQMEKKSIESQHLNVWHVPLKTDYNN